MAKILIKGGRVKPEIVNIPKDFVPTDSERALRMDEYLKEHKEHNL